MGEVFINGCIPGYYVNKNRKVYCSDLVRFLNEIKYFENSRDSLEFNLSYSNSIEKMDFSSVEKCFKRMAKLNTCLEVYYWGNCQTTDQMEVKYIKITGSTEKIHKLIRTGVFFTLKQENEKSFGVVRQVYLSGKKEFDMSVDLEDVKILFTPKDELVLDIRGMFLLNGKACSHDLANLLHETTFSDKDGRIYLFNNNGRSFFDEDVSAPLILKTWFSPKINCLNIKDGITLASEINENTSHYVMSSYDAVQSISPQTCYA